MNNDMVRRKKATIDAMHAHTNLNLFASVQAILEGGCVYGSNKSADRIVDICKSEQTRQLGLMDKAIGEIIK